MVDFTGRHDFESFKQNTDKLNELETYRQLTGRAAQCGYRINKVVYRGYGAPERLQQMHDQAIEARTRLQLERATEQQAQDLENYKLDSQLARAGKRRAEQIERGRARAGARPARSRRPSCATGRPGRPSSASSAGSTPSSRPQPQPAGRPAARAPGGAAATWAST